jgi:hypothetical protein
MPRRSRRPSSALATEVQRLLRLLRRPAFRRENLALLQDACPLIARLGAKPGPEWEAFEKDRVVPFAQKWRAWPAMDWWLVLPRQPRAERTDEVLMMLTGEWGLIPVFPWTTDAHVLARTRQIRRRVGKRHRDSVARHRGPLARWLETNGIPRREIPRLLGWQEGTEKRPMVVHGPEAGFEHEHDPEAGFEHEQGVMQSLKKRGLSHQAAERRVLHQFRGSEAPAAGRLRQMQWRFDTWRRAAEAALVTPTEADPVSFAVTRALRARYLTGDLRELTRALQALVPALAPKRRTSLRTPRRL